MRNVLVSGDKQRRVLPYDWRGQDIGMPRQSADNQLIVIDLDTVEPRDAIDVDEPFRGDHPQIHHRNQALAPG
jgi:hypothetical protein